MSYRTVPARALLSLTLAMPVLAASMASAQAAPDLSVSIAPPPLTAVYSTGSYGVQVYNSGNRDAASVSLTIQLPQTGTSPQVHVMGNLVGYTTPACAPGGAPGTAAGTRLICSLGTVKKRTGKLVGFDIQLPEKTGALTISVSATTTTPEPNSANNAASINAALSYYSSAVPLDMDVENLHCTGTGLTAFFECTKFPGSIGSTLMQFHDDGLGNRTITYPSEPGYTGTWSGAGSDLSFSIFDPFGTNVANFSGRGVPGGCFEGLTTFPGSAYVSPYSLCLP